MPVPATVDDRRSMNEYMTPKPPVPLTAKTRPDPQTVCYCSIYYYTNLCPEFRTIQIFQTQASSTEVLTAGAVGCWWRTRLRTSILYFNMSSPLTTNYCPSIPRTLIPDCWRLRLMVWVGRRSHFLFHPHHQSEAPAVCMGAWDLNMLSWLLYSALFTPLAAAWGYRRNPDWGWSNVFSDQTLEEEILETANIKLTYLEPMVKYI